MRILTATPASKVEAKEESWLKDMARTKLSQMPRRVQCQTNNFAGQLVVSWESVDSHRNRNEEMRVVLHSEGCTTQDESFHLHPLNIIVHSKEHGSCTSYRQVCGMLISSRTRLSLSEGLVGGSKHWRSIHWLEPRQEILSVRL